MHQTRRAHHQALVAQEVARPGVEAWLDEADAAGLGLAIASSSPASWVLPLVERLGLRARFSAIVTAEGALRGKPAPDTYIEACARLGVETRATRSPSKTRPTGSPPRRPPACSASRCRTH